MPSRSLTQLSRVSNIAVWGFPTWSQEASAVMRALFLFPGVSVTVFIVELIIQENSAYFRTLFEKLILEGKKNDIIRQNCK